MAYPLLTPLFAFILSRIQVTDVERIPTAGPFLLAVNHQSYLEPALLAMLAIRRTNQRIYSLTKQGIERIFRRLHLADSFGMIPVAKDDPSACLRLATSALREGFPLLIFPEGHRYFGTELGKGKSGIIRLAHETGAPVIPIGYVGPTTYSTAGAIGSLLFEKRIKLHVGEPYHPSPTDRLTADYLASETRDLMRRISALCGKPYPH